MDETFAVAREPMVRQYGFLLRFLVLFAIWGKGAYDYKLLMDQTPIGVAISLVFFGASILVIIGYRTRTSLIVLGLDMLLHAYLFHHMISVVGATLALVSSVLPIGHYYSLDRYLQLRRDPEPYEPHGPDVAKPLAAGWMAVFLAFAAFNIGGPAYNQIFHHENPIFLQWHMFHNVGTNMINVHFFRNGDRDGGYVDYAQVLGHKRKRMEVMRNLSVMDDLSIKSLDKLDEVITRVCRAAPEPATLQLDARVATRKQGWLPFYTGERICDPSGRPLLKPHGKSLDAFQATDMDEDAT